MRKNCTFQNFWFCPCTPWEVEKCDFAASRLKTYVVQKRRLEHTSDSDLRSGFRCVSDRHFCTTYVGCEKAAKLHFCKKISKFAQHFGAPKSGKNVLKKVRGTMSEHFLGRSRAFWRISIFENFWKNFAGQSRKNRQNGQNLNFGFSGLHFKLFEQFFRHSASERVPNLWFKPFVNSTFYFWPRSKRWFLHSNIFLEREKVIFGMRHFEVQ